MRRLIAIFGLITLAWGLCNFQQALPIMGSPVAPSGGGSAALVQKHFCTFGASPITGTCSMAAITAGNSIVLIVGSNSTGNTANSLTVTDNDSNTYSHSTFEIANTTQKFQVFCVHAPTLTTNPPTYTITDTDGSNHVDGDVREYSGIGCTFDGAAGATPTSTSTPTLNSITTTTTDVVVAGLLDSGSFTWSACGCGSFGNSDINNAATVFIWMDKLNAAAGSYAGTATLSGADATWSGTTVAIH